MLLEYQHSFSEFYREYRQGHMLCLIEVYGLNFDLNQSQRVGHLIKLAIVCFVPGFYVLSKLSQNTVFAACKL